MEKIEAPQARVLASRRDETNSGKLTSSGIEKHASSSSKQLIPYSEAPETKCRKPRNR